VAVNIVANIAASSDCIPWDFVWGSNLRLFLNNDKFSDVTFVVEGRPIFAHRVVLSLLSQRFRAMFSTGQAT
jgi:hypothetical protein